MRMRLRYTAVGTMCAVQAIHRDDVLRKDTCPVGRARERAQNCALPRLLAAAAAAATAGYY